MLIKSQTFFQTHKSTLLPPFFRQLRHRLNEHYNLRSSGKVVLNFSSSLKSLINKPSTRNLTKETRNAREKGWEFLSQLPMLSHMLGRKVSKQLSFQG